MPRLRRVSGREAVRGLDHGLERLGFVQVRQRGSHVVLKRQTPEGDMGCVVPYTPRTGDWHIAGYSASGQSDARGVCGELVTIDGQRPTFASG